jgi:23S rRNA (adenine1618-N6)-methyltransferase
VQQVSHDEPDQRDHAPLVRDMGPVPERGKTQPKLQEPKRKLHRRARLPATRREDRPQRGQQRAENQNEDGVDRLERAGWDFLGADIDPTALASASKIIQANKQLTHAVLLRQQTTPASIFRGLLKAEDRFDISICNPPFHASPTEARAGTQRKWKNLGKHSATPKRSTKLPVLNFGGQGGELWCEGGEATFIARMIEESTQFPQHCMWFSTLVSKEINLPGIYRALKNARVINSRTIDMTQGQKKSRIVAWTFLDENQQNQWKKKRLNQR